MSRRTIARVIAVILLSYALGLHVRERRQERHGGISLAHVTERCSTSSLKTTKRTSAAASASDYS